MEEHQETTARSHRTVQRILMGFYQSHYSPFATKLQAYLCLVLHTMHANIRTSFEMFGKYYDDIESQPFSYIIRLGYLISSYHRIHLFDIFSCRLAKLYVHWILRAASQWQ